MTVRVAAVWDPPKVHSVHDERVEELFDGGPSRVCFLGVGHLLPKTCCLAGTKSAEFVFHTTVGLFIEQSIWLTRELVRNT